MQINDSTEELKEEKVKEEVKEEEVKEEVKEEEEERVKEEVKEERVKEEQVKVVLDNSNNKKQTKFNKILYKIYNYIFN